jgi:hypothetical protein
MTRNVFDIVLAWRNNGFIMRASAQVRLPKRPNFLARHFYQVKEEGLEFVGECTLFSSG